MDGLKRIKSKPSRYKGYNMRSKLEVDWAMFFDFLKIDYIYEPEGYLLSDGTCYMPDFYLIEQNCYFECKGVMSSEDANKIKRLATESGKQVCIGYNGLKFHIYKESYLHKFSGSKLIQCINCMNWSFITDDSSWECNVCGEYKGNGHILNEYFGDSVYSISGIGFRFDNYKKQLEKLVTKIN